MLQQTIAQQHTMGSWRWSYSRLEGALKEMESENFSIIHTMKDRLFNSNIFRLNSRVQNKDQKNEN